MNPAKPKYQIIGTSDYTINDAVINVLKNKGVKKAMVVTSLDGIDEVTITDNTKVMELADNEIKSFEINPEDYGLSKAKLADIQVHSSEEAYLYGIEILNGKRGAGHDMVALNAGTALYLTGVARTIAEGVAMASKALLSGRSLLLLNKYAKFTQQ